jgi:hypothetical protein
MCQAWLAIQPYKALEDDAARRNVSVNTLVNQLFLMHTAFGRFRDQIGEIRLSRPTFCRLLNACPDKALMEASQFSGKYVPPLNRENFVPSC